MHSMKKVLLRSGALAICAALAASAQEERSPFGSPAAGANVQVGGAQAGVQAGVSQQTTTITTPLLLNLSGTTVKDEAGQQLGQIQHLIVSPQGCVDMAVLSLGGAKLVPIPWQLVEVSSAAVGTTTATAAATPGRIAMKLNVDRQKLQQAPSFSMNQINQITQQQTIQQVYSFYGVQQGQSGVGASASQSSTISGGSTSAAGGFSSTNAAQSSSQIGGTTSQTNQFGTSATGQFGTRPTNQFGTQSSATNSTGQLPPTGQPSGYPNRPSFSTNTPAGGNTNTPPGQPGFAPGRPENRPPANRPPDNRPPTNAPQGRPFQDTPAQQGQQ